ncbi:MAG: hypothetical protein AAGF83_02580 [Cyanobacteria bacterium P01_G01_bin.67]
MSIYSVEFSIFQLKIDKITIIFSDKYRFKYLGTARIELNLRVKSQVYIFALTTIQLQSLAKIQSKLAI